jgi:paraquat-inducible protein A
MVWLLLLLGLLGMSAQHLFLSFTFAGGSNRTVLTDGPMQVIRLGSSAVGTSVLLCSLIFPVGWGLGMLYVGAGLASGRPGPRTAGVLRLMGQLRPWVMLEVFLLGVLVTAGKLGHDGHIGYGNGFYLYLLALGVWVILSKRLKQSQLWERLHPAADFPADAGCGPAAGQLAGCQTCGFVQRVPRVGQRCALTCRRCHAELEDNDRAGLRRCAVLLLLAAALLLPANLAPIMRIAELGPPEPATVWEGIKVLYFGGSPGLALLVFLVSLCVPILKVIVLMVLLGYRRPRRAATARRMTKLHRLIATVGRWSMVDMFVVALLIGLVRLGNLASVDPQPGAIAFLAVVLITIVAAEQLNPRIFWQHTETPHHDR